MYLPKEKGDKYFFLRSRIQIKSAIKCVRYRRTCLDIGYLFQMNLW